MTAEHITRWQDLDPETREALDDVYRAEFAGLAETGVPESALKLYLEYRHERPAAQITTYEQGHVRRMLHRMRDLEAIPDPVELEDDVDAIERFGSKSLHLTHSGTFLIVLFAHLYVGLLALLFWVLLR